ncbi:MAG: hypothetical protein F2720_04925 [Actinobacteria bacterium]|nr:hypothetical protein [Actinomycetota bacterium]MTB05066.1 hypothetical protein [Actinomycetota bacterium]
MSKSLGYLKPYISALPNTRGRVSRVFLLPNLRRIKRGFMLEVHIRDLVGVTSERITPVID